MFIWCEDGKEYCEVYLKLTGNLTWSDDIYNMKHLKEIEIDNSNCAELDLQRFPQLESIRFRDCTNVKINGGGKIKITTHTTDCPRNVVSKSIK